LKTLRIFGIDDHPMVLLGLAAVCSADDRLRWAGGCERAAEALSAAIDAVPDVAVVDLVMPGMDAPALVASLRHALPRSRCLALTCTLDAEAARAVLAAGASGVLLKSASAQELVQAVCTAHEGGRWVAPAVARALSAATQPPGADLTHRERELLALLARGLANEDISARLAIAIPTVKFHVTNILSKLHADNRTAAVLTALRHRIVRLEETGS
jgi:two-component system, NarL family, response regulator LiaR